MTTKVKLNPSQTRESMGVASVLNTHHLHEGVSKMHKNEDIVITREDQNRSGLKSTTETPMNNPSFGLGPESSEKKA